jgi:hypothetical protein
LGHQNVKPARWFGWALLEAVNRGDPNYRAKSSRLKRERIVFHAHCGFEEFQREPYPADAEAQEENGPAPAQFFLPRGLLLGILSTCSGSTRFKGAR